MSGVATKAKLGSGKLANIGKTVRKRLTRHERVEVITSGLLELFIVQGFLTGQECTDLMALIDATSRPSTLYKGTEIEGFRTSYSGDLDPFHPLVQIIEGRICKLMGVDKRHGETLQGQRYAMGQQFKPHHDFFHPNQSYWEMERARAAAQLDSDDLPQRTRRRGRNEFPQRRHVRLPRAAMLVLWNNMDPIGAPNELTLHEGCAVTGGTKYIVTKWFREHFWG